MLKQPWNDATPHFRTLRWIGYPHSSAGISLPSRALQLSQPMATPRETTVERSILTTEEGTRKMHNNNTTKGDSTYLLGCRLARSVDNLG
jgi:hypothetical protein